MPSLQWSQWVAIAWPLLVAVVLGFAVRRLLLGIARRERQGGDAHLRARVVKVIAAPAALGLPLLFLSIAVAATPLPGTWIDRAQHWLGIGALLCLTWLAVRAVGAVRARIVRENPLDVSDNLRARRLQTQIRVLATVAQSVIVLVGVSIALMTFPAIRQIGATLLASAGVLGLVAGIAARPVFGNLIAGLQIALAQPIRIDDVVIVEGQWGRIEEITASYVVVRIWDERRLVVPLQWFIENPFENWTRSSAQLLGTALLWLDYGTPMAIVREQLQRICEDDERWDGRVCVAQITDTGTSQIQVRLLVSARNSGDLFDLRCAVRERMLDFLATHHPGSLPRSRIEMSRGQSDENAPPTGSGDAPPSGQVHSPGAEDPDGTAAPPPSGGSRNGRDDPTAMP